MPETDGERLRRARAVAQAQWRRKMSVGAIEQLLIGKGFDAATSRTTARHLFTELLEQLEREERMFRLAGAGVMASGLVTAALGFAFGPWGLFYGGGCVATFGALSVLRGFWMRGRIRATRASPWMTEPPGARAGKGRP